MGHRTALSVVEEFGLLDAVHPGRLDLGLGRSASRDLRGSPPTTAKPVSSPGASERVVAPSATRTTTEVVGGVLLPPKFSADRMLASPRVAVQSRLLYQPGAQAPEYSAQVRDILAFLNGSYRPPEGVEVHVVPGEGADVQLWILGSSGGESANLAGQLGLRFAANYHVSPSTVLEAVGGYRSAFVPSSELERPYVCVSADVVVAEDDTTARCRAEGYALWVRSIRTGEGAIAFPSPSEAEAHEWNDVDRALVADRVDTQLVGSPATVVARLRELQRATGADELAITTITHEHADRLRSYELLAEAWSDA
jgi:luciferase family oxidoreductase group 1